MYGISRLCDNNATRPLYPPIANITVGDIRLQTISTVDGKIIGNVGCHKTTDSTKQNTAILFHVNIQGFVAKGDTIKCSPDIYKIACLYSTQALLRSVHMSIFCVQNRSCIVEIQYLQSKSFLIWQFWFSRYVRVSCLE